ncbi:hypothetical protein [Curtobacterium sp. SL109]|uniref:hypothetical protein n=1 Tax=Curtobacterium sp. SL109 TaxID=2994662 RepID=UPI00227575FA|nr:hypothetical protein [Curtobacterium sp. SL109]MCY1692989.1 hypothetical protein [Curtobacterium sp. SL109]
MTALTHRVDAATVTLEDLAALEGTTLVWRGRTASVGALFSPLEGEMPPDLLAVTAPEHMVDLLEYQPDHRYRRVDALTDDLGSVAAVLDRLAALAPAEPVVRFGGGLELDGPGLRDVPAVALWTGRTW